MHRGLDAEVALTAVTDFLLDTHVHVTTDDVAAYPRAEAPPFETHDYTNRVEDYLGLMDEAGVACATLVQPFAIYGSDNAYQSDAAASCPARFVGVCGLSPAPDAAERLRHWVQARGMAAVRINTRGEKQGLRDPNVDPLLEEAATLGVPATILMSRRHIETAGELAARHPRATIALDHVGGAKVGLDDSYARLRTLAGSPNIFLKISTEQLTEAGGAEELAALIKAFGAGRIVWGSNYPVTDLGGYAATVQASRDVLSSVAAADREMILGRAALSLWPSLRP